MAYADNPQVWSAGLNLGLYGFTIGGSVAEQNNYNPSAFRSADGTSYDAGIAYETGPWGFSFTYFHGENGDDENFIPGVFAPNETLKQYLLGINYDLAKGVALVRLRRLCRLRRGRRRRCVGKCRQSGAGTATAFNPGGDDVDGWVVGTGIKVSF